MKTKNYDDFEDFLTWLNSPLPESRWLSVIKVTSRPEQIVRKNLVCYFRRNCVTVYDHYSQTLHRWQERRPNPKIAQSIFRSQCDESFNREIEARLMLYGYLPSPGEWTPAGIKMLLEWH